MDENRKKLYDQLSANYDMGTFDEFDSDLDNEDNQKVAWEAMGGQDGYGDFGLFQQAIARSPQVEETQQAEPAATQPIATQPDAAPLMDAQQPDWTTTASAMPGEEDTDADISLPDAPNPGTPKDASAVNDGTTENKPGVVNDNVEDYSTKSAEELKSNIGVPADRDVTQHDIDSRVTYIESIVDPVQKQAEYDKLMQSLNGLNRYAQAERDAERVVQSIPAEAKVAQHAESVDPAWAKRDESYGRLVRDGVDHEGKKAPSAAQRGIAKNPKRYNDNIMRVRQMSDDELRRGYATVMDSTAYRTDEQRAVDAVPYIVEMNARANGGHAQTMGEEVAKEYLAQHSELKEAYNHWKSGDEGYRSDIDKDPAAAIEVAPFAIADRVLSKIDRRINEINKSYTDEITPDPRKPIPGGVLRDPSGAQLSAMQRRIYDLAEVGNLTRMIQDAFKSYDPVLLNSYIAAFAEKENTDILSAKKGVADIVLQKVRAEILSRMTPENNAAYASYALFGNTFAANILKAGLALMTSKPGETTIFGLEDEALANYGATHQHWWDQVVRGAVAVGTLAIDAETIGFSGPSFFSGLAGRVVANRASNVFLNRLLTSTISGAVNFGTFEAQTEWVNQLKTGERNFGKVFTAYGGGLAKGAAFGMVGSAVDRLFWNARGWVVPFGEAVKILGETATFSGIGYLEHGKLTAEDWGTNFGMVLSGKVKDPAGYIRDVQARMEGKRYLPKINRISKEYAETLSQKGYSIISSILRTGRVGREQLIGLDGELNRMRSDNTVPWETLRMAEYALDGRLYPSPPITKVKVERGEDSAWTFTPTDNDGRAVGESITVKGTEAKKVLGAKFAHEIEKNNLLIKETASWDASVCRAVGKAVLEYCKDNVDGDATSVYKIFMTAHAKHTAGVKLGDVEREIYFGVNARLKDVAPTDDVSVYKAESKREGYDLDRIVRKPADERSEPERIALKNYIQWLNGREVDARDLNEYDFKEWAERAPEVAAADSARIAKEFEEKADEFHAHLEDLSGKMDLGNVVVLEHVDQVADAKVRQQIERSERIGEKGVPGWYDADTDTTYVYLPHNENIEDLDRTIMHEQVTHHGLRVLKTQSYNDLCDRVWNSMSDAERDRWENYPGVKGIDDQTKRQRAAADEYIAHLAERTDPENEGLWKSFVANAKEQMRKFGIRTDRIGDAELERIIRESYRNLREGRDEGAADGTVEAERGNEAALNTEGEAPHEETAEPATEEVIAPTETVEIPPAAEPPVVESEPQVERPTSAVGRVEGTPADMNDWAELLAENDAASLPVEEVQAGLELMEREREQAHRYAAGELAEEPSNWEYWAARDGLSAPENPGANAGGATGAAPVAGGGRTLARPKAIPAEPKRKSSLPKVKQNEPRLPEQPGEPVQEPERPALSEKPLNELTAEELDGEITRLMEYFDGGGQDADGSLDRRLSELYAEQSRREAEVKEPVEPQEPQEPAEPMGDGTQAETKSRPTEPATAEPTGAATADATSDEQRGDAVVQVDAEAERRAAQEADPYYMPMENKGGGRMSPNWRKASAEQIFNHLNDRENASGRDTLDGNIADGVKRAEDKLKAVERREPKGKGRSDAALDKWEKELSEARAQLEKWREVERMRREQKAADGDDSDPTWKQAYDEFNSSDEEPVNLEDYVARHLYGTKFKWKDKKFENTGGRTHGLGGHLGLSKSDKERRGFFGWIDEKNGSYPESVAEGLYANMPNWMRERYDTMEVLDAVLSVVGSNPRPRDMVMDYVKRLREQNRDMDEYYADEAAGLRGFHDAGEMDAYDNMREREAAGFHDVAAAGREADGARADLLADAQARLNDPNASEYEKQAARTVLRFRQRGGRDGVTAQGTEGDGVRFRHRAPNGEESRLDERQYDEVRTGNFKRWFGDWENDPENASKVVDANGEPLVVYHQTNAKQYINRETGQNWDDLDWRERDEWDRRSDEEWNDAWEEQDFYTFDNRNARQSVEYPGFFFSPRYDEHHEYGDRTIAAYLDMKNPAIDPDIPNAGVTDTAGRDAMESLMRQGYDGVIRTEDGVPYEYIVFRPEQIKSATENNGDFSRENGDIRFRYRDEERRPTFYSNAERAVENVKQGKATAEQWKAMLMKAGGIKAGEDKWMGLTDWLDEHKGQPLTKDEVLQFVRDNGIRMEEVNYGGDEQDRWRRVWDKLSWDELYDTAVRRIEERGGDSEEWDNVNDEIQNILTERYGEEVFDHISYDSEGNIELKGNEIHSIREDYTTPGLENKREIAFVVPGIEPYQENDAIHFGPENEGRAVMWVRFGETRDTDGNRVLVIDEVQSNRHQDAREKGYVPKRFDDISKERLLLSREINKFYSKLYGDGLSEEENIERKRLITRDNELAKEQEQLLPHGREDRIPAAPFEKNWMEVAMKRMLRLAAEEGFDKVAWTTGMQQAERYDLGKMVDEIRVIDAYDGVHEVMGFKDGERVFDRDVAGGERGLSELIGKEMARKAYSNLHEGMTEYLVNNAYVSLTGKDLAIGGDGMRGFYDQMLPRFMDKYGKKWGAKVGEVKLNTPGGEVMHSVDVTEPMKESVLQGQPLFRIRGEHKTGDRVRVRREGMSDGRVRVEGLPGEWRNIDEAGRAMQLSDPEHMYVPSDDGKWLDVYDWRDNEVWDIWRGKPGSKRFEKWRERTLKHIHQQVPEYAKKLGLDVELIEDEAAVPAKQAGRKGLSADELGFYQDMELPDGKTPVFVDNVVGSGETAKAATQAMGGKGMTLAYTKGNLGKPTEGLKNVTVTYDDAGNLIPLSERFDRSNSDVRFRVRDGRHGSAGIERPRDGHEAAVEDARRRLESGDASEFERQAARAVIKAYGGGSDDTPDTPDGGGVRFRTRDDADMLVDMAKRNNEVERQRRDAVTDFVKAVTDVDELTDSKFATALGKVMRGQRQYDQATVADITTMVKAMMDAGLLTELDNFSVKQILTKVKDSTGKNDTTAEANKLIDIMLKHQLKKGKQELDKSLKVTGQRVDSRGVVVQAGLDPHGQLMVAAFKEGMKLDEQQLDEQIAKAQNDMSSSNQPLAADAAGRYDGLLLARQHLLDIRKSEADEVLLKNQLTEAKELHKAGMIDDATYKQLVESINDQLRDNKFERIEAYNNLQSALGYGVAQSVEASKQWRESNAKRVGEIQHNANSDLEGVPTSEFSDPSRWGRFANNIILRFLNSSLPTFDFMLRFFGSKNVRGEGYLFNRFMRGDNGYIKSSDRAARGEAEAMDALSKKASELFGKKMRFVALGSLDRKLPKVSVEFLDGGEMKPHELTQGQVVYMYMVNKMADGRQKLRAMGITQEAVDSAVSHVDQRLVKLADWIQDEFNEQLHNKYNAVHQRVFGSPLTHIANYFPLRVNSRSRLVTVDNANDGADGNNRPSTITGGIIKRTRNSYALDLPHNSFVDVMQQHISEMEHWAAFAEFNRDINTLLSYKNFRNKVANMTSFRYGSGNRLLEKFEKVAALAGGGYRPAVKESSIDNIVTNIVKGLTVNKIAFRLHTALKQLESGIVYLSEANPADIMNNMLNLSGSWNWAIENLPGFTRRWVSRTSGDYRLRHSELDWKVFNQGFIEKLNRWGMTPNAFVDAMTVAVGARSIYDSRFAKHFKDYLDSGLSQEDAYAKAHDKALMDATTSFNETQQSSEEAFVSTIQADRTVASAALTAFRNASMGYQRRLGQAYANLARRLRKGYKEQSIEFMTKQGIRDGLSADVAERAAKRAYRNGTFRDIADVALFGFFVQFGWNMMNNMYYQMFGDDDEEKKEARVDAAWHSLYGGQIEGLAGGNILSDLIHMKSTGQNVGSYNFALLPFVSDMQSMLRKTDGSNPRYIEAATDAINILIGSGTGVNPQVLTDAIVAGFDACEGDLVAFHETMWFLSRLLQVPQSEQKKFLVDRIGKEGADGKPLSLEQVASRYGRYVMRRNAPLGSLAYDGEQEIKLEKRYAKQIEDAARKRDERLNDEEFAQKLRELEDKGLDTKGYWKDFNKRAGVDSDYGKPDKDASAQDHLYYDLKTYEDHAGDVAVRRRKAKVEKWGKGRKEKGLKRKGGKWHYAKDADRKAAKEYFDQHRSELEALAKIEYYESEVDKLKKKLVAEGADQKDIMRQIRELRNKILAATDELK